MKRRIILRKEHFGGFFVDTARPKYELLDHYGYAKRLAQLSSLPDSERRLVQMVNTSKEGWKLFPVHLSAPSSIFLELTRKCNNNCVYCFANSSSRAHTKEMSFEELDRLTDSFVKYGGFYIRLGGGEPTFRPDFFRIVDMMGAKGICLGLNTNGLFSKETLDGIISRGIRDVRISLDGPKGLNDSLRGKGTFDRITRTLDGIAQFNSKSPEDRVDLTINVVLSKNTFPFIDETVAMVAGRYKGVNLSFGLLRVSGRAQAKDMLSAKEVLEAAKKVQKWRESDLVKKAGLKLRVNYDVFCEPREGDEYRPFPFDNSKCPLASAGMGLTVDGKILPCGYMTEIGNGRWLGEDMTKADYLGAWNESKVLTEARGVLRKGCEGCSHHGTKCNGGCPVMSFVFNGVLDGKDPYCVRGLE